MFIKIPLVTLFTKKLNIKYQIELFIYIQHYDDFLCQVSMLLSYNVTNV